VYHRLTNGDRSEIAELLAALRTVDGPILELACGSGRLTLPLLATGADVTALDLSPAMIDVLLAAVAAAPKLRRRAHRLTACVGDASTFAFGRRFGAIVFGTASVTLLGIAQRAACFARVRDHLAPGGRFFVSVTEIAGAEPRETIEPLPGVPPAMFYEYLDPASGRRWTSIVITDASGEPRELYSSAPALLSRTVLERELADAGLTVVAQHAVATGVEGRRHWVLECAS
jgi:methylation protein MtfA